MRGLKKRTQMKQLRSKLLQYLNNYWKDGHSPSLDELLNNISVKNIEMLKKILRDLRINRILDASYDMEGVYRIYPFKQYDQIKTEIALFTHYK